MRNNKCIAHRGWSGQAPENTLAAIRMAANHPEIDMIEVDVQMSRDGVPVIIHDYILDRTTNGSGKVGDFTLEELKKLDAGFWFNPAYTGETIPTLEEVLIEARGKAKLNLEIKRAGDWYPAIENKVVELVQRYDMESDIVITSFNHETMRTFTQIAPAIKTGLLIYGYPVLLEELLAYTGASALSMGYDYLTENLVRSSFERGLDIIAWTVDEPQDMKRIASLDERIAICTNHPDRWLLAREA
ncbi:glycerophosphodiester phosphodiesterase family protein [Aneurinibacillus sp. Ricciae_BoGa-3]|uniref:glycerophosphodiester phosphodiesterase n=1 Tax=Aneurinibacillus sp. Ricciae_BoGa-3 TaxID=3022697 RepID=UPI00234202AD|nr:glycerophosphodiester phosphodiesterase family protein [Aneurinibacillus sp. Ricciae_BoGa-3]WCK54904.1 glycerophosphodiester phosphodiesterase family protein [Aneurinibacillus sp. Ricciae_BoGa-3]